MSRDSEAAADRLIASAVGLLLEPLPVDEALNGSEMLELADDLAKAMPQGDAAAASELASLLQAACTEWSLGQGLANELREAASAGDVPLSAEEAQAALAILKNGASARRLRALQGFPQEALDVRPAEAAFAIQTLRDLAAARRETLERHLSKAHASALDLDFNREIRGLRDGGWLFGLISTTSDAARDRVSRHLKAPADHAGAKEMANVLETVKVGKEVLDRLEDQWAAGPAWTRWVMPDVKSPLSQARAGALTWLLQARADGTIDEAATALLMDNRTRRFLAAAVAQEVRQRTQESALAATQDEAVAQMVKGLSVPETTSLEVMARWREVMLSRAPQLARAVLAGRASEHDPRVRAALDAALEQARSPFGPADPSRPRLRRVLDEVAAAVNATHAPLPAVSHPAISDVIRDLTRIERQLTRVLAPRPSLRGPLRVAIAGRTKAGKTTLRKTLTRDGDASGIGRGAHRTTRQAEAFGWRGIEFVDTPGVAAYDDDFDSETAMAACRDADAVLWVYAETLRVEELEHLSALLAIGKPVLVVINVKWRVATRDRLELFTELPRLAFRHLEGHAERVADVAAAVGACPPTVLPAHLGAAFEALRTTDSGLSARAHTTSRLPELEQALHDLLVHQAQPLRAAALAESVRTPLTVASELVADTTHRLKPHLAAAREQFTAERRDLAASIDSAERAALSVLERKLAAMAKNSNAFVRQAGGSAEAQTQWQKFVEQQQFESAVTTFADRMNRDTTKAGLLLEQEHRLRRKVWSAVDIDQQPRRGAWRLVSAALIGAIKRVVTAFVGGRRLPGRAAAGAAARKVPWLGWALIAGDVVGGAASAVADESARSRVEESEWHRDAHAAVHAEMSRLGAVIRERIERVATEARHTVKEHLDEAQQATDAAEQRLKAYQLLMTDLQAATSRVDLVLAQRLATLCACDPGTITRTARTPASSFHIWTRPGARLNEASLRDTIAACLREDVTITPEATGLTPAA